MNVDISKRFLRAIVVYTVAFVAVLAAASHADEPIRGVPAIKPYDNNVSGLLYISKAKDSCILALSIEKLPQHAKLRSMVLDGAAAHFFVLGEMEKYQHLAGQTAPSGDRIITAVRAPGTDIRRIFTLFKLPDANIDALRFEIPSANVKSCALKRKSRPAISPNLSVEMEPIVAKVREKTKITVHVMQRGMPFADLRAFYGEPAYAVAFDSSGADIVPAHVYQLTPGEIEVAKHAGHDIDDLPGVIGPTIWDGASVAPDLSMHFRFPSSGTYRIWLELNGSGSHDYFRFNLKVH
jgi:hypothetical protein